jgi:hypothetical protein
LWFMTSILFCSETVHKLLLTFIRSPFLFGIICTYSLLLCAGTSVVPTVFLTFQHSLPCTSWNNKITGFGILTTLGYGKDYRKLEIYVGILQLMNIGSS